MTSRRDNFVDNYRIVNSSNGVLLSSDISDHELLTAIE
jgi:hypothetical protein